MLHKEALRNDVGSHMCPVGIAIAAKIHVVNLTIKQCGEQPGGLIVRMCGLLDSPRPPVAPYGMPCTDPAGKPFAVPVKTTAKNPTLGQ